MRVGQEASMGRKQKKNQNALKHPPAPLNQKISDHVRNFRDESIFGGITVRFFSHFVKIFENIQGDHF
jgi:hypothetical protein